MQQMNTEKQYGYAQQTPVVSTTMRVPVDVLRELQHVCIDRHVSQTDAIVRGIRLWIDGWEERSAVQEFAPKHEPALRALRETFHRGVSVVEVVAVLSCLGRDLPLVPDAGETPRDLAAHCLRTVRRLLAALESDHPADTKTARVRKST